MGKEQFYSDGLKFPNNRLKRMGKFGGLKFFVNSCQRMTGSFYLKIQKNNHRVFEQ